MEFGILYEGFKSGTIYTNEKSLPSTSIYIGNNNFLIKYEFELLFAIIYQSERFSDKYSQIPLK